MMEKNPIGFNPSCYEKILYLDHKTSGESMPSEDYIHIPTIDVYGNREPWELFEELLDKEEIHFFSKLKIKKRRKRGSLPVYLRPRSVGKGAWEICPGQSHQIFDHEADVVGHMTRYVYRNMNPSEAHQDKRWVLEEYTLSGPGRYQPLRFCTVTKNTNLEIDTPGMLWPERIFDVILIEDYKEKKLEKLGISSDPRRIERALGLI